MELCFNLCVPLIKKVDYHRTSTVKLELASKQLKLQIQKIRASQVLIVSPSCCRYRIRQIILGGPMQNIWRLMEHQFEKWHTRWGNQTKHSD